MNRLLAIAPIVLAGCGTKLVDPCAHQSGACLALHIDSSASVSRLSSAHVHVAGDMIAVDQTVALQNGASSTDLPVALAITFPGLADTTSISVDVVGLLAGSPVGEGSVSATVTPAQHATLHLQLAAIGGDGDGGAEDMASSDLTGYFPLTVELSGGGTGTVSASGLACTGTTCTGQYLPNTMVTLAATPAANATFAGWSGGGCTGTANCVVTVTAATAVTATFDWKFVPSHAPASAYKTDAANLSGVTAIDTHNLQINGAAPPAGVTFAFSNGIAVLSVGQWTIDAAITVTGDSPLIVVAAGAVVMNSNGSINASGSLTTPGPGGNAACATGSGGSLNMSDEGAGGGGNFGGGASASLGAAGTAYGDKLTDFCGGAKGGDGGYVNNANVNCATKGKGGGGGGAVQISSAMSITIQGQIKAGGGGGDAGCTYSVPPPGLGSSKAYPGGGGSGGLIFLEAPTISMTGSTFTAGLYANGGGGGGPYGGTGTIQAGVDGRPEYYTAEGGLGGDGASEGGNGAFSPDGASVTPATAPNPATAGGGGGGVGRIWFRTKGTMPSLTNSYQITPPARIDMTL